MIFFGRIIGSIAPLTSQVKGYRSAHILRNDAVHSFLGDHSSMTTTSSNR